MDINFHLMRLNFKQKYLNAKNNSIGNVNSRKGGRSVTVGQKNSILKHRSSATVKRKSAIILVLSLAGLLFAACSSAANASATKSQAGSSAPPLVIYSAQGYDKAEVTAFEKATGIKVNLDDNSTGPLLDKIQAEKNNPQWGLLWVDGDEAFAQMDLQGMLLKGFEPNVSWNSIGTKLIPSDKSYIPTGVTMAGTVIYNSNVVHNPPTTWNDLLQSKWQYVVGMNDPSISGPTYPFVAGIMNYLGGVSKGEQYFTNLQSNGLDVHETNGDTLQALEVGHIKIGIIQSSAAIGATIKHPNLKVVFPNPVTAIPSVIGIDRHAPAAEIAEAKKFAEFVLSPAGQKVMQSGDPHGDSLYWPVLNGVQPLPALPSYSSIPHVQVIDPYKWGPQEAQVNSWFDNNIA